MKKIAMALAPFAFMAAGVLLASAPAHADTVGQVARQVCAQLDANPTPANMNRIVQNLLATYSEADENKVMDAAMHYVCPEYMPVAIQALKDRLAQMSQDQHGDATDAPTPGNQQGADGIQHGSVV